MNDLVGLAIVLVVSLTGVTLVGHGLWVLLAKLFGGNKGAPVSERCPRCGAWLPAGRGGCPSCGWAASRSQEHRRQDVLKSLFEQIVALDQRGMLDESTKQLLIESVLAAQAAPVEQLPSPRSSAAAPSGGVPTSPQHVAIPHEIPLAEVVEGPQATEHPQDSRGEMPVAAREAHEPPPVDVQDRVRRYTPSGHKPKHRKNVNQLPPVASNKVANHESARAVRVLTTEMTIPPKA